MITKENYITASFIDNERKNIEVLLRDLFADRGASGRLTMGELIASRDVRREIHLPPTRAEGCESTSNWLIYLPIGSPRIIGGAASAKVINRLRSASQSFNRKQPKMSRTLSDVVLGN